MKNPLYDTMFGPYTGKDTPFLHLPEGGVITHGSFVCRAAQLAHALVGYGVKTGDRVAVQVGKCTDMLALYAGCAQMGAIFLPLNTAYTAAELSYFVEDSGATLLVGDPARTDELAPVAQAAGAAFATLDANGGSLSDRADQQSANFETVARSEDDLAAFLYTSGTTGRSKGAMLSQKNLIRNAATLTDLWQFTNKDVLLHALPIFHTHGLFVATNVMLMAGGSMVFIPKLDIDQLIEWMPQATSMMGVPTFYTRLLDDPRFDAELSKNMRLFISGSAPLLADTHVAFEQRTGHRILERYGMTETNMNTSNPYDGERRAGTVGLPLPDVELRVSDANGTELPRGETGVVEVRGPNVFQGYWNMPEKTKEELREDGFFITGDLGVQDDAGYVTIVGRGKDLIISGGYNIYPKELELVLDEQAGVLESAVIGIPHDDLGEVPLAVLVPQAGMEIDLDAVKSTAETALARFKQPREYRVVDALPRNTMGKVQKVTLRAEYGA
ncbi:malonate--CoA ligase [Sulfitobacter donghicola]|uniref:Malonyl-CoA synthase n=1 Tax=Sulfitobacter donghicola DSW-25 = KCTC 12864 = JCM 14565 TaxID=1300350 RepID=A0A073IKN1_9RHOB|nr:malonyl-CoA synthase [Sulfitobacter donghicola]KEJ90893.1 malonyl-CoA synthase [Sulfitobacter donghicola DSW-25 = KCTC 12864 = JCM 14565]KIN68174.1 Malonyl-CoA synthase [Sulfitobacter donghicola DSW-25 = KCTC 12864 = JCM 14565]